MKNVHKTIALLFFLALNSWALAKTAPFFRGDLLNGGKISLDSSIKPGRLLLLSFWATWCLPRMEELTHVRDRLKTDTALPLDVLTVNVDKEQQNEVASTMAQLGITFPVVKDPQMDIFAKYQKASTLPYSVLINPSRVIEEEFNGYHETMFEKIHKAALKLKKPGK